MIENNLFYMQKAYKSSMIAFLNNCVPIGCVVTDKNNNEFVEKNLNHKNTNGKHAEMLCVDRLSFIVDKSNFFVYTTMVPCPMCSGYLYMKGIGNIYIGTDSKNKIYNENFELLLHKKYKHNYLKNKCSYIVSCFFKKMR